MLINETRWAIVYQNLRAQTFHSSYRPDNGFGCRTSGHFDISNQDIVIKSQLVQLTVRYGKKIKYITDIKISTRPASKSTSQDGRPSGLLCPVMHFFSFQQYPNMKQNKYRLFIFIVPSACIAIDYKKALG